MLFDDFTISSIFVFTEVIKSEDKWIRNFNSGTPREPSHCVPWVTMCGFIETSSLVLLWNMRNDIPLLNQMIHLILRWFRCTLSSESHAKDESISIIVSFVFHLNAHTHNQRATASFIWALSAYYKKEILLRKILRSIPWHSVHWLVSCAFPRIIYSSQTSK